MPEMAVFERMRNDVPLIVGPIVSIPVIVAHVRHAVHAPALAAIHFGLGMRIAMWRRCLRILLRCREH